MAKRKIFAELMEGIATMQAQREGKMSLTSYKVKPVDCQAAASAQKRLNVGCDRRNARTPTA
jgi:hypothetical protein